MLKKNRSNKIVERINSWTLMESYSKATLNGVGVVLRFSIDSYLLTGKIGVHQRVYILRRFPKCDE